ncbi:hypothetical protein [Peribacillus asahii]|uniref:hypothetical protein n=1 Tax=Peribacillus asahii TaxID=228899 RepID=UPI0038245428
MKKFLLLGLTAVFAVLLTACGGEQEKEKAVDLSDASIPVEERVTAAVHNVVGEKVGDDLDTVSSIKNSNGILKVEINSEAHEGSKQSLLNDSAEIFASLAKMDDITSATISWLAPLTDPYGNKSMGEILTIMIDGETFEKVNWDNYEALDLEQTAPGYKQHDALKD